MKRVRWIVVVLPITASAFAQAGERCLDRVQAAQTVAELRATLNDLANEKGEEATRALLWGSILFEGTRSRTQPFPPKVLEAGKLAASRPAPNVGTRALQAWWRESVGRRIPPDMRKGYVRQYATVMINGKPERMPVYGSRDDEAAYAEGRALRRTLLASRSREDALVVYQWWTGEPTVPVANDRIEGVAGDASSSFRKAAIAELSIRERRAKRPGRWTELWNSLKKGPKTLYLRTLIQREKEQLATHS